MRALLRDVLTIHGVWLQLYVAEVVVVTKSSILEKFM
jgi:hypothetical protein